MHPVRSVLLPPFSVQKFVEVPVLTYAGAWLTPRLHRPEALGRRGLGY
jgi:hypothetical protein